MMSGKRKLGLEYHHKQTDLLTALLLKMIGHIIYRPTSMACRVS